MSEETSAEALPDLETFIQTMDDAPVEAEAAPEPEVPVEAPETPPEAEAAPEATPAPVETPSAVSGLAELVQRENLFRQRQETAQEEANAREQVASLQAQLESLKTPEGILDYMNQTGVSPDDVTRLRIQGSKPADPTLPVRNELSQLREEVHLLKTQRVETARKAAEVEARTLVGKYISDNAEKYPLVNAMGYQDHVFNTMFTHLQQTGEVLSEEAATATIEQQLSGFREKLLGASPNEVTPPASKAPPKQISNSTASQMGTRQAPSFIEDDEAAMEAAIALIN